MFGFYSTLIPYPSYPINTVIHFWWNQHSPVKIDVLSKLIYETCEQLEQYLVQSKYTTNVSCYCGLYLIPLLVQLFVFPRVNNCLDCFHSLNFPYTSVSVYPDYPSSWEHSEIQFPASLAVWPCGRVLAKGIRAQVMCATSNWGTLTSLLSAILVLLSPFDSWIERTPRSCNYTLSAIALIPSALSHNEIKEKRKRKENPAHSPLPLHRSHTKDLC